MIVCKSGLSESLSSFYQAYQDIMPDHSGWWGLGKQVLPIAGWSNSLRITLTELQSIFASDGIELHALPDVDHGFVFYGPRSRLSKHWTFACGLFQIQEVVAMMAGQLLSLNMDDRVLDMCSAPGNKSAQMSVSMNNRGLLIANDKNASRLPAVGQLIKRLGLNNMSVTLYDGRQFPRLAHFFDKILVDAPCSGEGTFRKTPRRTHHANASNSRKMAGLQLSLLKKAHRLLKPGGTMVYSTCTFSPIENEQVLDDFITLYPDMQLCPITLSSPCSQGLCSWQGRAFSPSLSRCVRLWPQQNNSGGFFMAKLRKNQDKSVELPIVEPMLAKVNELSVADQQHLRVLNDYFQWSPDCFAQAHFFSSRRGIMLIDALHRLPQGLNTDACGQLFLKTGMRHPKITTAAAIAWASEANSHVLDLTAEQKDKYLRRESQSFFPLDKDAQSGLVLLRYLGYGLGTGYLRLSEGEWILDSFFPKSMAF